jgi:hypothetical protein
MASVSNITNKVIKSLGKTEQTLVSTSSVQKGACVGLSLANVTDTIVKASVFVTDNTSTKGYYIKDLEIAPQSSARIINGGEKLLLAPSNSVSIGCDTTDGLDVIFSLVVITYS